MRISDWSSDVCSSDLAYVLESHRGVGLNDLAQRYLGRGGITYEELSGKGAKQIGFDEVAVEQAGHYACETADLTLHLHHELRPRGRPEEHTSELKYLMRSSYAVFTLTKTSYNTIQ